MQGLDSGRAAGPVLAVEIRRAEVGSPVAAALIHTLDTELSRTYPEPGATHFRLDADEVAEGRGAFLVVSAAGRPVGCGAIRCLDRERAEIKRMYVCREMRGRGIGRALLDALEEEGRRLGARRIVLETGERQVAALELYARAGYTHIERFGEYAQSPLSICMEKSL